MANGKTEYRIAYGLGINADASNRLRNAVADALARPDFGSLTLLFSSGGGNTDEALGLYNFFTQLPAPVHMHATGHIGSAAVTVFLAGTKRTASPLARFFFHEYDWGFDGTQTLFRIEEAVELLKSDIEIARKIMRARTRLSEKILGALDGTTDPEILDPEEAKDSGVIEAIAELPKSAANGMAVAIWNA